MAINQTISSGRKTVTNAGTAVQLFTTFTPIYRIDIAAFYKNTDMILVGDSTVLAGNTTDSNNVRVGIPLSPGQTITIQHGEEFDASQIYLDAVVSGEGISYSYYNR